MVKDEPLGSCIPKYVSHKPSLFFEWFRPLAGQMFEAKPNPAHQALADLEHQGYMKSIITQNIDALHQKAGSKTVIEMHGTMQTLTCTQCYHQVQAEAYIACSWNGVRFPAAQSVPRYSSQM
jgi:NAD-dependent SIR2 family protein deacetylase